MEVAPVGSIEIVRAGLSADAVGVDHGYDGHGHARIREVNTANHTIVLERHCEEVFVRELVGVAGRLQRGHHELVCVRDFLLLALLLLEVGNLVLDLVKLDIHALLPVAFLGSRAVDFLTDDGLDLSLVVALDLLLAHLLNSECNFADSDLAVGVVDLEVSFGHFIGAEHVLVKLGFEG